MNSKDSGFTFVTVCTRFTVLGIAFLILEISFFAVFTTFRFSSDDNSLTLDYWNNDDIY